MCEQINHKKNSTQLKINKINEQIYFLVASVSTQTHFNEEVVNTRRVSAVIAQYDDVVDLTIDMKMFKIHKMSKPDFHRSISFFIYLFLYFLFFLKK